MVGLTQKESFEKLDMLDVFEKLQVKLGDYMEARVPEEGRELVGKTFKIANAINWKEDEDIDKAIETFVHGFDEQIQEYKNKGREVSLTQAMSVFADPILYNKTGEKGFYGWIEVVAF